MKVSTYYEDIYKPGHQLAKATIIDYDVQSRHLNRYGLQVNGRDPELEDLSDEFVEGAMRQSLIAGNKPETADKIRRYAQAVWNFAVKRGLLSISPKTEKLRFEKKDPIAFLPEDKLALWGACDRRKGYYGPIRQSLWWRGLVLLLFSTAQRIGALRELRSINLDLDRGDVFFPAAITKQKSDQRLEIFRSCVDTWREIDPRNRTPLVLGDFPHTTNTLRVHLKQLIVDAGLAPNVESVDRRELFHKFRRTTATEIYLERGIHVACEFLGHSSPSVTWRYIDPRFTREIRVREILPDPLGPTNNRPPTLTIYRGAS